MTTNEGTQFSTEKGLKGNEIPATLSVTLTPQAGKEMRNMRHAMERQVTAKAQKRMGIGALGVFMALFLINTQAFAAVVPGNEVPDVKLSNRVELTTSSKTVTAARIYTSTVAFQSQHATLPGVAISSGLTVTAGTVSLPHATFSDTTGNTAIGKDGSSRLDVTGTFYIHGSQVSTAENTVTTDGVQNITGAKSFGAAITAMDNVAVSSGLTVGYGVHAATGVFDTSLTVGGANVLTAAALTNYALKNADNNWATPQTHVSSITVTAAEGLGVTYGISAGSGTFTDSLKVGANEVLTSADAADYALNNADNNWAVPQTYISSITIAAAEGLGVTYGISAGSGTFTDSLKVGGADVLTAAALTNYALKNADNNWSAPQTHASSITVVGTAGASDLTATYGVAAATGAFTASLTVGGNAVLTSATGAATLTANNTFTGINTFKSVVLSSVTAANAASIEIAPNISRVVIGADTTAVTEIVASEGDFALGQVLIVETDGSGCALTSSTSGQASATCLEITPSAVGYTADSGSSLYMDDGDSLTLRRIASGWKVVSFSDN